MMSKRRSWRAALLFLCSLGAIGLSANHATATSFTWTGDFCTAFGCGWAVPINWSPSGGPPGAGDRATIAMNSLVLLSEGVGPLNGLTLENGVSLFTIGSQMNVTGPNANTFLFGTGPTGGNTQLVVNSGVVFGFDYIGHFLSLHQGAELKMQGGGAIATFGFNVSLSSLISGFGTVLLTDTGTKFDVAGTVRPMGGDLALVSLAANRLDLDGNISGVEHGLLGVTADGNLSIIGSLADAYSGLINISNSNSVEFGTALDMNGELNFMSSTGNRLIAPSITFEAGAQVTVDQAIGEIDAVSVWPGGAQIQLVNPTDELHFADDSTFAFSTVFGGSGLLVNDQGATMTLEDGADVSTRLLNHGTLEIGTSTGSVLLEEYHQSSGGRLNIGSAARCPSSILTRSPSRKTLARAAC